jgi:alpha,alpha-trehalase
MYETVQDTAESGPVVCTQCGQSWTRRSLCIFGGAGVLLTALVITLAVLLSGPSPSSQPYWARVCSVSCSGPIIAAVNSLGVFNDSKTFVDLPLLQDPETVLSQFNSQFPSGSPSLAQMQAFLSSYFGQVGSDLVAVSPTDWAPSPLVVQEQGNATLRWFAQQVNAIWLDLTRKVTPDVTANPQRHTLLPLPRPFVVPGGRFREVYFWDALWIVHGLIRSEMFATASATIENLAWQSNSFSFVPNGARAYYLDRSQPPVLALMTEAVFNATGNASLVNYVLPAVMNELTWFGVLGDTLPGSRQRVQLSPGYVLHRYNVQVTGPRPESYKEDMQHAADAGDAPSSAAALGLWGNIASAAESGWDFSSRWLADQRSVSTADTSSIVPADLNSILVAELQAAARLLDAVNSAVMDAPTLRGIAQSICGAMNALLWDETQGWWADWSLPLSRRMPPGSVTPAAWFPLWAGCATGNASQPGMAAAAAQSLQASGLWQVGGIMTSQIDSSQQWDEPAAWAPLQWVLVGALENAGAMSAAKELARSWIYSCLVGYQERQVMMEKYDAFTPGGVSGGGEYTPQKGFGWTNGVVLDLLARWNWTDVEPQ